MKLKKELKKKVSLNRSRAHCENFVFWEICANFYHGSILSLRVKNHEKWKIKKNSKNLNGNNFTLFFHHSESPLTDNESSPQSALIFTFSFASFSQDRYQHVTTQSEILSPILNDPVISNLVPATNCFVMFLTVTTSSFESPDTSLARFSFNKSFTIGSSNGTVSFPPSFGESSLK